MSTASINNVQAAAAIASAVANSLATAPAAPMTAGTVADVLSTVLQAAGRSVGSPEIGLVIALASLSLKALHNAQTSGAGLETYTQAVAAVSAANAADLAAHPST